MPPFVSASALSFAILMAGISTAGETPPNNLRICVQFIEVPLPTLTEMMDGKQTDGTALHQQAMALVKSGDAKLVDSDVVTTPSGRKATLESICEMIYPSETEAFIPTCGLAIMSGFPLPPPLKAARNLRFIPPCFSTRNTGATLEVEPILQDNGQIIDLRLVPEIVTPVGEISPLNYGPEWGGGPVRMPIFESLRINTCVSLMAGKFELISVFTPKVQAPAPAVGRKILVFVRADVVPVLHSP